MLLDEPLITFDANRGGDEIRNKGHSASHRRWPIIYVTHDQAEAMAMSDRILLLHNARVQQLGTPRDPAERPENQSVADFIGLINFLKIDVAVRDGRTMALFIASSETPPSR